METKFEICEDEIKDMLRIIKRSKFVFLKIKVIAHTDGDYFFYFNEKLNKWKEIK